MDSITEAELIELKEKYILLPSTDDTRFDMLRVIDELRFARATLKKVGAIEDIHRAAQRVVEEARDDVNRAEDHVYEVEEVAKQLGVDI